MPVRARLAILLAASFAVAAAFFATLSSGDDTPATARATFRGGIRPPGIAPADFTMRDQDGRTVTLRQFRGTPVVITFLYTSCQDTCPLTAQQIRGGLDDLGHDVPVLAVAVDPPRDTPERARRFLAEQRVTGRMRFLLGPVGELRRQWKAYGIRRQSQGLEHSAYVVLLDKQGRQRIGYPSDRVSPEDIAHDLRLLERERS